jgi:hypothetical protein
MWRKQTIILSRVDAIVALLKQNRVPHKLTLLSRVEGRGADDLYVEKERYRTYMVRKLEFQENIVLEQLVRTKDIELDDYIISKQFCKEYVPKNWHVKVVK